MKSANFNLSFPVIDARAEYLDTVEGIADYLFTLDGEPACAIGQAERASFYGIHSTRSPEAARAVRLIYDAIASFLTANRIACFSYSIISALSVDTDGTKTPYRAIVYIRLNTEPAPRES